MARLTVEPDNARMYGRFMYLLQDIVLPNLDKRSKEHHEWTDHYQQLAKRYAPCSPFKVARKPRRRVQRTPTRKQLMVVSTPWKKRLRPR